MKTLITLIVILLIGSALFYSQGKFWTTKNPPETATTTPDQSRAMPIEDYIRLNISTLSSGANTPEVLGGKFYVTGVEAHGGAGTVSYEDGHNAYTADFTYNTDERGMITITSFKVR